MGDPTAAERKPPPGVRVQLAALADAANATADGKLNVLGVFDVLWTQGFPAVHPMMAFVAYLQLSANVGPEVHLQLRCLDEDMHLVGSVLDLHGTFTGGTRVRGVAPSAPVIIGIRHAEFDSEGTYSFELWLNDQWVCAADLHVIQLPESAGA